MPLRGVVFDFDGVIANTEPLHLAAYQDVLADTALSLSTEDYYARYLGYDDIGVFTALSRDQGVTLDAQDIRRLIAAKGQRFEARVRGSDVLFPDAAACIKGLAERVHLGIASQSKPAPESYQRAVRLLAGNDTSPDTAGYVAIEDSLWGITAAHAAGLPCVAVTHSYPAETLLSADLVLSGLGDLQLSTLERLCPLDE